jgi:hypothetical protein
MKEKDQSSIDNQDAVQLIVQRNITKLFKSLLDVVDDLKQQNSSMLLKVSRETSMEFVQQVNYLTPEIMDHVRKRILDLGNESIREISSILECFELKVNENKLEKLLKSKNNRRTSKSVRISGGILL